MAVYLTQTLSQRCKDTIANYTKRLAVGLNCLGIDEHQFVYQDEKVFVIDKSRVAMPLPFLFKSNQYLWHR